MDVGYGPMKEMTKAIWSLGDYRPIARLLEGAARAVVDASASRLETRCGDEVLDVAAAPSVIAGEQLLTRPLVPAPAAEVVLLLAFQQLLRWRRGTHPPRHGWTARAHTSVDSLDGQLMHVLTQDGVLWRTLPCLIPPGQRHRLQGVRLAGPAPLPKAAPAIQRRVSSRGGIQVAHQRIQVGMAHAGKIVTVICENNSFRLVIDGETARVVPRTTSREIDRYKAYATRHGRR
jgi:hypothetical protein